MSAKKQKILYLDAFNGVSGNMLLGALLELGLDKKKLIQKIDSLGLDATLAVTSVSDHHFTGTHVAVSSPKKTKGTFKDIQEIIKRSTFSEQVKKRSISLFEKILKTEAEIHKMDWKTMHVHELGSADAIIDITGILFGFESLGIHSFYCSTLPLGSGEITCQHGIIPLPSPATTEFLKNFRVNQTADPYEKITPTGAVIINAFFSQAEIPEMTLAGVGYGFGSRRDTQRANFLRLFLGTAFEQKESSDDTVFKIETTIDDMSPEVTGYVIEKLLQEGALDVNVSSIIMKKGRPGHDIHVLVTEKNKKAVIQCLFEETTTFGIRLLPVQRICLQRNIKEIVTKYGKIPVKIGYLKNRVSSFAPEYEACKKIAKKIKKPLREIMACAIKEAEKQVVRD